MSEALPADPELDADLAMLSRMAQVGMASLERVHERLMAADDNAELNTLSLTETRLMRCVRQTLILKARLKREGDLAAERRAAQDRFRPPPPDPQAQAAFARAGDLQDALTRIAHAMGHSSDAAVAGLYERLDVEVDEWLQHDDFPHADLGAQVRWLCRRLDYPADLAETWQDLPHPDDAEPPWAAFQRPDAGLNASDTAPPPAPTHESSA